MTNGERGATISEEELDETVELINSVRAAYWHRAEDRRVTLSAFDKAADAIRALLAAYDAQSRRIAEQDKSLRTAMWHAEQDDKENDVLHERIADLTKRAEAAEKDAADWRSMATKFAGHVSEYCRSVGAPQLAESVDAAMRAALAREAEGGGRG